MTREFLVQFSISVDDRDCVLIWEHKVETCVTIYDYIRSLVPKYVCRDSIEPTSFQWMWSGEYTDKGMLTTQYFMKRFHSTDIKLQFRVIDVTPTEWCGSNIESQSIVIVPRYYPSSCLCYILDMSSDTL